MNRPKVALIGCGASGMLFLHALATRQRRDGDDSGIVLPFVVCFERADQPGGCWRSPPQQDRDKPHNSACWHDGIWNNVCKEAFEFADYTFEEHFQGKSVPTFLPRPLLLDYLEKRTTRVDPNLYQRGEGKPSSIPPLHEMRFNTAVTQVRFDSEKQQFEIQSAPYDPSASQSDSSPSAETTTEYFDYCVWGAGLRGKPRIPRSLLNLLRTGGDVNVADDTGSDPESTPTPFTGKVLHSIHCSTQMEEAVRGKRIVLIGDSNSAEEIALQSTRRGVEKCYILSRSGFGDCAYMGSWPSVKDPTTGELVPKVEVHLVLPYRIVGDGRTIKCAAMEWNPELELYEIDETSDPVTLYDIDTLIICTGFVPNMDFLSEELNIHSEQLTSWYWTAPEDFKMKENAFTPEVGDVPPSRELSFSGNIMPGVYRAVLIENPRMMYIMDFNSEYPLLQLEALAWLCLAFITGEVNVPSKEEMEQMILQQMIDEMHIAYLRWSMDDNYFNALDDLEDPHWSDDYDDERCIALNKELLGHHAGVIARDFKDAKYPVDFGTYGALNENGNKLVDLGLQNILMRHLLDKSSDDSIWKTYRDIDPSNCQSIYTSQVAAPLPRPWIELDAKDVLADDDDDEQST